MLIEKLPKLKYIYHLADLHIRNVKRHREYREVLNKFLEDVDANSYGDEAAIYIGGDIAHAKTEMSPELVREITWFFTECAKRHSTFIIAGNHDCNLNNKDRLDVLTPICENLNFPNLYYLRDTGVYQINDDITFTVYSILDNKVNWPKANDVSGNNKVCFFHGPVKNSETDIGYTISSDSFTSDMFDGFDAVLMGDIHRRQLVQTRNPAESKPVISYVGSCIQQNHGEYLEHHGYLIWNVNDWTFKEVDIHNDWGYLTIDVDGGHIPSWVYDEIHNKLPKFPRLRVRFTKTSISDIKKVTAKLQKMFNVTEITVTRNDNLSSLKTRNRNVKNLAGNIRDVNVQNQLIKEYVERQFLLSDETIDKIIEINNQTNSQLTHDDSENILWIPKLFEFSNMFSYGENNKIDFTKANGIIGLFAPNATGKSAVWDALSFCIFDKCSRAFKATHIMNNQKDNFYCKFKFEIDGIEYYIERVAKTIKGGKAKVDVQFWKVEDGEIISLNGDERRDTNDVIRKYLGTYEDFVMTSMSLQGNNALFIDKSQSERKDVLAQYIGVNIFDKLYDIISSENKEADVLLKAFKRDDLSSKIVQLDASIKSESTDFTLLIKQKESLQKQRDKLDKSLIRLESKIKRTVNIIDIHRTEKLAETTQTIINNINDKIANIEDSINNESLKLSKAKEILDQSMKWDENDIKEEYSKYTDLISLRESINKKIKQLQSELSVNEKKLSHLEQHEYDPNCSYCMNNVFVKDAINTKQIVENQKKELNTILSSIQAVVSQLEKYNGFEERIAEIKTLTSQIASFETNEIKFKVELANLKLEEKTKHDILSKFKQDIISYNKNKKQIEKNIEIKIKIDELIHEINHVKLSIKKLDDDILRVNTSLTKWKTERCAIEEKLISIKNLEEKHKLYEYYLDAVKRDGISYELISKSLPMLEEEVNNILGQIVDFQVNLEMDGKNVNAFMVYGDDRRWPLEMCSGMERFVSSLAIRIALLNICNLPRPNFLLVDEGLGTLDSENLNSMYTLFSYLKTQFSFVILISHLEIARDMVDSIMEVKKINGFSNIKY